MKKRSIIVLSFACLLLAACVLAADDEEADTKKLHLKWVITPANNVTGDGFYCVNETLAFDIINPYTKKPIKEVLFQVYYNYREKVYGGFTTYTGRREFTPNMTGFYTVVMTRDGYYQERAYFNASVCTTTSTTTTSTTTTTTTTTSTMSTTTTTTTTSTSTTAAPSCSDGLRNQGEEGVDCGAPCAKACASLDFGLFFGAVIALFVIALVAYALSKRGGRKAKYSVVENSPNEAEKGKTGGRKKKA